MDGGNWKEMFKAVEEGDYHLTDYHLKRGVDPNYQHPEFLESALVEAVRQNHLDIAKLLIDFGADPLIKDIFSGETPLSLATKIKNEDAISLIKSALIGE